MARGSFFTSEKTPWDEPSEIALWILVSGLAALFVHNAMRTWKEKH